MIDLESYRSRIGCYSNPSLRRSRNNFLSRNAALLDMVLSGILWFTKEGLYLLYTPAGNVYFVFIFVCILLYTYILCIKLAFVVDISRSDSVREVFSSSPLKYDSYMSYCNVNMSYCNVNMNIMTMVNLLMLCHVVLAISTLIEKFPRKFKVKYVVNYFSMYSTGSKVALLYTLWLASINIELIVLANPSILNPGPGVPPNLSLFYQNVKGLIPFTSLGSCSPMLDNTKVFELQSYVFQVSY